MLQPTGRFARLIVSVPVMQVGCVWVRMHEVFVPVRMRMRFAGRIIKFVHVLMVLVVHMHVLVLHRLVRVLVFVMFGKMQPDAEADQSRGNPELRVRSLAQEQERENHPHERRGGEICAGPRRAQMTQREDKRG